ncbi:MULTISPECIES: biotin synthase BioB [unclassified Luteococcus]|uniref:biotin synthase BioB n=1 Tax=unclassified Luteococcus TaxID=2639923 RepID=UPI00313AE302
MTRTALTGESISREQALEVLTCADEEIFALVAAASRVRRKFFGNRVKLNYLVNLKSGRCAEDCGYCSQRLGGEADILKYTWLKDEQVHDVVEAGLASGVKRVCMVASGTGPSNRETDKVAGMIEGIKAAHPEVEVCACLGFVTDEQAKKLRAAGADAYNHNVNTAESHYADICSTHTYQDRTDNIEKVKGAGLSPCSGLIAGMGESKEQLVEAIFALRELGVDSVPVNFLLPFDGTPMEGQKTLQPLECLRILAMVRLVHPDTEVRAAAGREQHLRSLQTTALELVNSIFLGDYLTSEGQAGQDDLRMIADAGFVVEGQESPAERLESTQVPIRRRGAGTELAPNV